MEIIGKRFHSFILCSCPLKMLKPDKRRTSESKMDKTMNFIQTIDVNEMQGRLEQMETVRKKPRKTVDIKMNRKVDCCKRFTQH